MKALVLTAYNELQLKEVPKPVPAEDEVLVHIKACAICGSDVHGYDGGADAGSLLSSWDTKRPV